MAKKFTGIEITADSIRKTEVAVSGGETKVLAFSEYPLGTSTAEERLSELAAARKIEAAGVCTGIDGGKVFFRETSFPFGDKKKVLQALPFSLSDTLPFPLEEALYCTYPFRPENGRSRVVSLAAKRETVFEREKLLSRAGLVPSLVTAESEALRHLFRPAGGESKKFLLLHMGRERTLLSLSDEEGCPLFLRTLSKGTIQLISSLAHRLELSETAAADLLFRGGEGAEKRQLEEAGNALRGFLSGLVRELELALRASGTAKEEIPALTIAGEGSLIAGIGEYLSKETGLNVSEAALPGGIELAGGVSRQDLLVKGAASLGFALNGAMEEGLNFIEGRSRLFESPLVKLLHAKRKAIGVFSAVILLLYTLNLAAGLAANKKRHDAVKAEIARLFLAALPGTKRIVNEKQQLKTALADLEEKVSLISDSGQVKTADILREITAGAPESTPFRVTRMRIGDGEVKLEGETDNFDGVEKIKKGIVKSPLFESVEVGGAKASRLQNVIEFQLNIKVAK